MPSSTEIRWIAAYALAGAVACGSSDSEDFFAAPPPHVAPAGAPGSSGHGGSAGSVASGGTAGSALGAGGAGGMPGAGGKEPGTGGAGTSGSSGDGSGAGGGSSGTGGAPPLGGAPGIAGAGGGAMAGVGGGDAGSPAAGGTGGRQGRGGRGGGGGSGPAQCDAVLATANAALLEAQQCNLAISSPQCVDLVDTVCGCKTPVARIDSAATKTYLAALAALGSCSVDCLAVECENPTSGSCMPTDSGSIEARCVGDSLTPF